MNFQYRDGSGIRTINVPQWAIAILAALAFAVGLAVVVLGFGLFLVIVPLLVIAGLIARWRLRRILREAERRASRDAGAADGGAIEVEYRVVDERTETRRPGDR